MQKERYKLFTLSSQLIRVNIRWYLNMNFENEVFGLARVYCIIKQTPVESFFTLLLSETDLFRRGNMLGVLERRPVSLEQAVSIIPRPDEMLLMSSVLLPALSFMRLLSLHKDSFCFVDSS